jgi:hypothetical protein
MTDRDTKGRFVAGNSFALIGWRALVTQRFAGDERACRAWWGCMGAWHYDAPYRADGLGAIPHPGTPEEFLARYRNGVTELAF